MSSEDKLSSYEVRLDLSSQIRELEQAGGGTDNDAKRR